MEASYRGAGGTGWDKLFHGLLVVVVLPTMVDPRIPPYKLIATAVMAACTVLSLVLWLTGPLDVHRHEIFQQYVGMTLLMAALAGAMTVVRDRMLDQIDMDLLKTAIRWAPEVLQLMIFLYWVPGMITIADYLVLPISLPLVDALLAAPEEAIGLTHPVSFAWFERHGLVPAFASIYALLDGQVKLVAAYYLLVKRDLFRLWQYTASVAAAGVVAVGALWALPARGPTTYYEGQYPVMPPATEYIGVLDALRAGEMLDYGSIAGLLSCPSFHTVFALLLTRAWIDAPKPVFAIAAVVNSLVVVSTIPIGSHYLVDIAGGIVWSVLFAVGIDRLARRLTPTEAPAAG